jgi:DNA polymerase-3 subunit epsilon
MKSKLLFIDTETTGLNPKKNGIIQIAALYEEDEFETQNNPLTYGAKIDKEALKINGIKKKWIKKMPDNGLEKFVTWMDKHVNKYDKSDKFVAVGYNVKFDVEMLHGEANRQAFEFMGSYIDWRVIDVLTLVRTAHYLGQMPAEPTDFKLGTICKVYGIPEPSHNALDDVLATRALFEVITKEWR